MPYFGALFFANMGVGVVRIIFRVHHGRSDARRLNFVLVHGGHRINPYPMVWPLPRPWSENMVSIPL